MAASVNIMAPKRKAPALGYEERPSGADARPRPLPPGILPARPPLLAPDEPLALMVLDIHDAGRGRWTIFGSTPTGASVAVRVLDHEPHWWVAAPEPAERPALHDEAAAAAAAAAWDAQRLGEARDVINGVLGRDCQLARVEAHVRRPILYYR